MPTTTGRSQNASDSPLEMIAIDLDGTLVDSVGDLHAAVVRMQKTTHRDTASIEDVRHWVGNGIERLVHRAMTGSMDEDASADIFDVALAAFLTAYDDTNGTASQLYPGVESGLEWLTTLKIPLVCVTNKAGRFSRPLVRALGIDKYFKHHIAGDDVENKKPHPAALLEAARLSNARPAHCLVIGDSISDIRAGRAADFSVVAVTYGYNHGRSVSSLTGSDQPDAAIDSFDELPKVLSTYKR
ncbi:MAG: phosphoglycolate phosphatase [Granulosicoccus sp.]